jgi:uncharacterized protein (DUF885 family)
MNHLKRWTALGLALAMTLVLASCGGTGEEPQTVSQQFDAYLEELPSRLLDADSMDLNFLFQTPQNYGIQPEPAVLPFDTQEEWEEDCREMEEMLQELDSFPREELEESQLETLDIFRDYLERRLSLEDYFYLDDSYLGTYLGFQAQLPLLLNEWELYQESDLESYFHILETAEETFLLYAQREQKRQDQGVGMSQVFLDGVAQQCDNFVEKGCQFLVDSLAQKIDQAEFLTQEEKDAAKERSETLHNENLISAYRSLGEAVREIQGPEEVLGLASLPQGKEYYTALVQCKTGTDMTMEELLEYLQGCYDAALADLLDYVRQDPEAYLTYLSQDPVYTQCSSVEDLLEDLAEKMTADYPPLPALNFQVNQVPAAMADNFSPAAYLQSRIDTSLDQKEVIYLNGEYDQSLFSTVAHEGYPGHMYQNVYFKSLGLPAVRYIVGYTGWTEGWANYVEMNSYRYADGDPAVMGVIPRLERLTQDAMALVDVGIHWEGWDFQQAWDAMNQLLMADIPEETAYEQYKLFVENPGNYLNYYFTGNLFQDLYNSAEEELGDAFDPVAFHKAILDLGPAPFSMVETAVDGYVEESRLPEASQEAA